MTLIKSISGIRGTIGGAPGEGLSPIDVVRYTSAYGTWVRKRCGKERPKVVVGRDARISGEMVKNLVLGALQGDRKSTRLNFSHVSISYAVFYLKKKKNLAL